MESLPHTVAKMFGPPSNGPAQEKRSSIQLRKEHDVEAADGMYGPRSDCFVFEAYPEVKKAFIRRVYQILVGQLLLTTAVIYCIRAIYNVNNTISLFGEEVSSSPSPESTPSSEGPSMGALSNLFWAGFLGSIVSLSLLHFVARRHPLNLAVLFAFTFFESLLLSSALIFVPAGLLFQALLTTTVVFVGLILYTLESKADYSFLHSYLGSALWIIIAAGFFQLFWPMGDTMDTIYTWGGALVFCGFIIYDTWRLHFQLKPDEYVLAAASLYLDFINLFLRILHLLFVMFGGPPWVGVSLMPHAQYRRAIQPLLDSNLIDAIEWSCDVGWGMGGLLPAWVGQLLDRFSKEGRLFGHGVLYSPTSAVWERRQASWLRRLQLECEQRKFGHITEHFGFMTAGGALEGCPLPLPFSSGAVRVGVDRLRRMHAAAGGSTPVGLENLALAMGADDVVDQGAFISAMLTPLGDQGVMLLDLHNLYCQTVNFSLSAEEAMKSYPLERVHAIHISGGSWCTLACDPHRKPFRRDTHDGDVPPEIIDELLPLALRSCPNLGVVILERLGETIRSELDAEQLRDDFLRIRSVVEQFRAERTKLSAEVPSATAVAEPVGPLTPTELVDSPSSAAAPFEDEELGRYQAAFLRLFVMNLSPDQLLHELRTQPDFAPYRRYVEGFDIRCVEVASLLVRKWVRFARPGHVDDFSWRNPWSDGEEDQDEGLDTAGGKEQGEASCTAQGEAEHTRGS